MSSTLKGIIAAVLTPMNSDLTINLEAMVRHCNRLLSQGCDGLGVLGTTGESTSFSAHERIALLEGLAASGIPMDKVIPGTGASAFTDTIEMTKCAARLGCAGALVLPPYYYKGVSDDGLFDYFTAVIKGCGDDLPAIYLYNFPQQTGITFSHDLIEGLRKAYPEVILGIKDSSDDKENMLSMIKQFPGFAVFPGSEKIFAEVLAAGGAGCITAINNLTCHLTQRIYSKWLSEKKVDTEAVEQIMQVRAVVTDYPLVAVLKAIRMHLDDDKIWKNIRPPLTALAEDDLAGLNDRIDGLLVTWP